MENMENSETLRADIEECLNLLRRKKRMNDAEFHAAIDKINECGADAELYDGDFIRRHYLQTTVHNAIFFGLVNAYKSTDITSQKLITHIQSSIKLHIAKTELDRSKALHEIDSLNDNCLYPVFKELQTFCQFRETIKSFIY